ncbi:MAG: DUF3971 domain-containing protein [Candidatus Aenigmatarchaeota archaeon]
MVNLRAIATVFIVLAVAAFLVPNIAGTGGIFGGISEKIGGALGSEKKAEGNIDFAFSGTRPADFSYKADNVNITINPKNLSVKIKEGDITRNEKLTISGYKGSVSINADKIILSGTFTKLEYPDISIPFQSTAISSDSTFKSISIEGAYLKDFTMSGISGTLDMENSSVKLTTNNIEFKNINGRVELTETDIKISGSAGKISIPDMKISVG